MIKKVFLTFLLIMLSGCHQGSSYVSKFGQSIVLNPNQTQVNTASNETISDQKLTNLTLPNVSTKEKKINNSENFTNIEFSSSKFLKGNPYCVNIIRIKVLGSLSYDELMYELRKRATTMGGNAIGIHDLDENKEVTFTNQRVAKKNSLDAKFILIKETNHISSVTADIFKCKSDI